MHLLTLCVYLLRHPPCSPLPSPGHTNNYSRELTFTLQSPLLFKLGGMMASSPLHSIRDFFSSCSCAAQAGTTLQDIALLWYILATHNVLGYSIAARLNAGFLPQDFPFFLATTLPRPRLLSTHRLRSLLLIFSFFISLPSDDPPFHHPPSAAPNLHDISSSSCDRSSSNSVPSTIPFAALFFCAWCFLSLAIVRVTLSTPHLA